MSEINSSLANLLLVDDDEIFCDVLSSSLKKRGFNVLVAHDVNQAITAANQTIPEFAIVDLNMPGPSGLTLIDKLIEIDQQTKIVVLTGYASITSAVDAIKRGATHYLTKPADTDQIIAAFYRHKGDSTVTITNSPLTVNQLEWEHLQRVLSECDGNVSEAARRMKMHRRTLQRKLKKNFAAFSVNT